MKKTIIVTGASRGIGYAIAEKFVNEGFNLAFCCKHTAGLEEAVSSFRRMRGDIEIFAEVCDMSDKEQVFRFGRKCMDRFPQTDILVNNAGIYAPGEVSDAGMGDQLEELMKVNLYSAYWLGKVVIPQMKKQRLGHIFTISSIAGLEAYPNSGSYTITKFALTGYTKALREELKQANIRVTAVYPGAVLTDSWAGSDLPKNRFIQPKDIAEMIYTAYNLSPSATVEDIIIRPQEGDI